MTTATIANNYVGCSIVVDSNGASPEARKMRNLMAKAISHLKIDVAWPNTKSAFKHLYEVKEECSIVGWDGYSAKPVSAASILEAVRFLELLPTWFPAPEVVPEPDGSVGFEWYKNRDWLFVVSVSGSNAITYAGLLGRGNKTHGARLFNDSIPKILIDNIKELDI